jgi:signal transduction histidine kinase/DNA-binding response OmpR family regulator
MSPLEMTTILVADEEPGVREMLRWELGERGYQVMTASDGDEAMAVLDHHEVDIVLSQIKMPGPEGLQFLRRSKQIAPLTEVVIATETGEIDSAAECVKSGAFGYIQRPYGMNDLCATLERALERRQLRSESALYQMSRVILDTREPHRLPDVIVQVAMEAMQADDVALMLPGHDDKLYTACSTALTESIRHEVHASIAQHVVNRAPMLREPLLEGHENVHSYILYPLCMSERLIGVLVMSRLVNPREFRKLDLDKASVIASQTLLALENMRLVRHAIAAERFATVGQVATSIAHEVNNPIAYVLASQTHLRDQLVHVVELCKMISAGAEPPQLRSAFDRMGGQTFVDELVQAADDVREGAARVRDILRDTRALAHNNPNLKPSAFDINESIRSALRVVAAELRHKAEITTNLAEGLRVVGVAGQLSQVFVNLLINAGEAFGNRSGNSLVITSKRVGGHILITLTDNGPGIARDQLPRIFDAFYTTKSVSGTGLGLPISRDIVRQHGGEISADSTHGIGTTFSIVLPQAVKAAPREPTQPPPFAADQEGVPVRLLFVDDEASILRSYKRAFGRVHDVVAVTNGKEALEALAVRADFDLVICDLSMPTMSGMQLYHIVRERYPQLADRFIFATGGATQRELEDFLRSVTNRVLEKPFDLSVLSVIINDLQRVH